MNENNIRIAIETGNRFDCYGSQSGMENAIRWSIIDAMKMRGQGNPENESGAGDHALRPGRGI